MIRLSRFWVGLVAFTVMLLLPAGASADSLLGPRPNLCQRINPGSYSPLHYWLPSLYTFRAYHRQGNFYDQAQYDLGAHDSIPADSCSAGSPARISQKKDVGGN